MTLDVPPNAGVPPWLDVRDPFTAKPIADAQIRLTSMPPDTKLTITGFTDAAGKFELSTYSAIASARHPGAPAGTFQVTLDLPVKIDQSGGSTVRWAMPVTIPAPNGTLDFPLK